MITKPFYPLLQNTTSSSLPSSPESTTKDQTILQTSNQSSSEKKTFAYDSNKNASFAKSTSSTLIRQSVNNSGPFSHASVTKTSISRRTPTKPSHSVVSKNATLQSSGTTLIDLPLASKAIIEDNAIQNHSSTSSLTARTAQSTSSSKKQVKAESSDTLSESLNETITGESKLQDAQTKENDSVNNNDVVNKTTAGFPIDLEVTEDQQQSLTLKKNILSTINSQEQPRKHAFWFPTTSSSACAISINPLRGHTTQKESKPPLADSLVQTINTLSPHITTDRNLQKKVVKKNGFHAATTISSKSKLQKKESHNEQNHRIMLPFNHRKNLPLHHRHRYNGYNKKKNDDKDKHQHYCFTGSNKMNESPTLKSSTYLFPPNENSNVLPSEHSLSSKRAHSGSAIDKHCQHPSSSYTLERSYLSYRHSHSLTTTKTNRTFTTRDESIQVSSKDNSLQENFLLSSSSEISRLCRPLIEQSVLQLKEHYATMSSELIETLTTSLLQSLDSMINVKLQKMVNEALPQCIRNELCHLHQLIEDLTDRFQRVLSTQRHTNKYYPNTTTTYMNKTNAQKLLGSSSLSRSYGAAGTPTRTSNNNSKSFTFQQQNSSSFNCNPHGINNNRTPGISRRIQDTPCSWALSESMNEVYQVDNQDLDDVLLEVSNFSLNNNNNTFSDKPKTMVMHHRADNVSMNMVQGQRQCIPSSSSNSLLKRNSDPITTSKVYTTDEVQSEQYMHTASSHGDLFNSIKLDSETKPANVSSLSLIALDHHHYNSPVSSTHQKEEQQCHDIKEKFCSSCNEVDTIPCSIESTTTLMNHYSQYDEEKEEEDHNDEERTLLQKQKFDDVVGFNSEKLTSLLLNERYAKSENLPSFQKNESINCSPPLQPMDNSTNNKTLLHTREDLTVSLLSLSPDVSSSLVINPSKETLYNDNDIQKNNLYKNQGPVILNFSMTDLKTIPEIASSQGSESSVKIPRPSINQIDSPTYSTTSCSPLLQENVKDITT